MSSAVRRTYLYRSFRPVSSLDAAIEAADPDLVVPCDDLATAHLHAIYERESRYGSSPLSGTAALLVRSLGSPASYSIIDSRQEFLALAREEGVLVPNSALTPELRALDGWIHESGVPAVLKTDCTSGGEGVRIVETRQQAGVRLAGQDHLERDCSGASGRWSACSNSSPVKTRTLHWHAGKAKSWRRLRRLS